MPGPAYQWGVWRFEPTECRLLRGGELVPLPAKSLDLLAALLKRAPRLITKEEILAAVWPDAAVEEGNIAFHVAALRKVLDEGGAPSVIETVRGRGYRFVADLSIHQLPATDDIRQVIAAPQVARHLHRPRSYRRPLLVALALIVVVAGIYGWIAARPAPMTIAVKPFEIVDPRPGEENLPDGLIPYLTLRLETAGVTVASPETAAAVLSGQLHPTPQGFRVTVQLTRTADNSRLWDWSYDQSADEGRPPSGAGPDDERSRMQGNIATHVAAGVSRYLTLIAR